MPSYRRLALSRPIRRDSPPARMTAASGTGGVTSERLVERRSSGVAALRSARVGLVDGPGVLAAKQRLQGGRIVRPGLARGSDLVARGVVVGRLVHLTENPHHHVF